ncbi:MAG: nucleotidyl transferase AbiEii/AbiGii toxin family protein [Candidatus Aenigmarchaeota archaeon]|nr:nucleotidyl transferase AbiEii/AbiGii toxin family protein [Candidatus Aenigmarchaeota archaeon]
MEKRTPLFYRIRKKTHADIARAQDMVVEIIYRTMPETVIHGGTAIWRCYSGSRFSEDIDVYIEKKSDLEGFFSLLEKTGFSITRKRLRENSVYSTLEFNGTEVKFEAVFKKVNGSVMEYETYEGILMNIKTLTPEELIAEKIAAYRKRKKIRDLFDIFFLLRHVKKPEKILGVLKEFLSSFDSPSDEEDLRTIILFGAVPTKEQMLDYIKRWIS